MKERILASRSWSLWPWAVVALVCVAAGGVAAAAAPEPATVTVSADLRAAGAVLPADFVGLSFEMEKLLPDARGGRFFSPDNKALLQVFRALGIKSLRVGGNTADRPGVPLPSPADIDSLFAFARAAEAKVLYTLRLREGSRDDAAAAARHILRHHDDVLTCFAIGNEPNVFAKEYAAYLAEWRRYVEALTAVDPGRRLRLCGPSATPGKVAWARQFVTEVAGTAPLVMITQHDYPGGSARKVADTAAARRQMLSPAWQEGYRVFHGQFVPAVAERGLPYRLEEANSFFHGGAQGVSDTFAAALWALDYMHWWAGQGAAGINFHTGDEVAAAEANTLCRYASFHTTPTGYRVHPIGYALSAFAAAGPGRIVPAAVSPQAEALAAYARLGEDEALTVTLVHKAVEGAPLRIAITAPASHERAQVLHLRAAADDAAATSGVTLGGAAIDDLGVWTGEWAPLERPVLVTLPAASAALVRLERTRRP